MLGNKGFAIALDALMAIILVTAIIVFLSQHPTATFSTIDNSQRLKQEVGGAFASLENSGRLTDILVNRQFHEGVASDLYNEAKQLLAENVEIKIEITEFESKNIAGCQGDPSNFENCFLKNESTISTFPEYAAPENKDVVTGKRILVKKLPGKETPGGGGQIYCELESELEEKQEPFVLENPLLARFDEEEPPFIEYKSQVFQNIMSCSDTNPDGMPPPQDPPEKAEFSKVELFSRNQSRNPFDVYLVLDQSGSMETYDMTLYTEEGSFDDGTCNEENCHSQPEGVSTNCGYPNSATESQCGNPNNGALQYYTDQHEIENNWVLDAEKYATVAGSIYSKLWFVQVPTYSYEGVCAECPSRKTPNIIVTRNSDGRQLYYDYSLANNRGYFERKSTSDPARLQAGDEFSVLGWNSEPGVELSAFVASEPYYGYYNGSYGTIEKSGEIENCSFYFPSGCTGEQCGDYKKIDTIEIPEDIIYSDTFDIVSSYFYLYFSGIEGECPPKIRVNYTPPSGSTVNYSHGTYCGGEPFNYCYIRFDSSVGSWYYTSSYMNFLPDGAYDFYVASQEDLYSTYSRTRPWYFLDSLLGPPPEEYNSGTCDNGECRFEIGSEANCPGRCTNASTFFNPDFDYLTGTNEQELDTFTITESEGEPEPYLRGLRIENTFSGYGGECSYMSSGFDTALPGDNSQHVLTNTAPTSGSQVFSHGINDGINVSYKHTTVGWQNPPLPAGDYTSKAWADGGALHEQTGFEVRWLQQRIDAAHNAAKNFIDNTNWTEEDKMGIISYSDNYQELHGLIELTEENRGSLKESLKNLSAEGETATANAIAAAHSALGSGNSRNRFIVLLSDGLANIPGTNPSEAARTEAEIAFENDGIVVYTIAFGEEVIDCTGEECECNEELTNIAIAGGGSCYPANDSEQLAEIYDLIAAQIQQTLNTTHIEMPLYPGTLIRNPECPEEIEGKCPGGSCCAKILLRTFDEQQVPIEEIEWENIPDLDESPEDWHLAGENESLIFYDIVINQIGSFWKGIFDIAVPCKNNACFNELIIPSDGTTIQTPDWNIPWPQDDGEGDPERQTIQVLMRNLGISFSQGIITPGESFIRFNLSNANSLDIDFSNYRLDPGIGSCSPKEILVRFFQDVSEPPDYYSTPIAEICIEPDAPPGNPPLNGDNVFEQADTEEFGINLPISTEGYIYGMIDVGNGSTDAQSIFECSENNWDKMYCFETPKEKYYIIKYWGWLE